jgi:hypothetical protein
LVTGATALRDRGSVWYAPAELLHRLPAASQEIGRPLVSKVRFLPSAERTLRVRLGRLDAADRERFERTVSTAGAAARLEDLPADPRRRSEFLEALLAYYQFKLAGQDEGHPDADDVAAKNAILRARLALPSSMLREQPVPDRASPTAGLPPMLASAGVSRSHAGVRAQLRWMPYGNELAGIHGLDNGELVVLDTRASVGREPGFRIEALDVLRVRKFNNPQVRIPGESRWSWQTRLGWRRPVASSPDGAPLRAYAAFGLGQALSLGRGWVAYGMVDGVAQSGSTRPLRLEPNAGLVVRSGQTSAWLYVEPACLDDAGRRSRCMGFQATRRTSKASAVRLELLRAGASRATLAWDRHW